jgi:hypothetical protein
MISEINALQIQFEPKEKLKIKEGPFSKNFVSFVLFVVQKFIAFIFYW